jgi:HlyD family secretion protein
MKTYPEFFFITVIVCLALTGCSSAQEKASATPDNAGAQDSGAMISATGVVVPEKWAALSARRPAVVAEVLVTEGERVSAGQQLVRLDGQAAAQADLSAARHELILAQQALDTLKENAASEAARAQQAVATAMQAVEDAQEDVDKLDYRRASDDLITQTQDEIDLAKKQVSRAEDAFKLVKKRPDGDSLKAEAELALTRARIYLDNRISYLNWYKGLPDEIDGAKYRAALAVAQADLSRSQAEYDRRKDGPDTKLLALAESRLALAKAQVHAAEESAANLELRAPFDGAVCNLDVRVGEWVTPGIPILQLGDLSSLRLETTDLSEIDAARIHTQDAVLVTFDALPDVTVKGSVLWVASKSAEGSGVNYTAVIVLEPIPAGLRWGMTAFADIEVSE